MLVKFVKNTIQFEVRKENNGIVNKIDELLNEMKPKFITYTNDNLGSDKR